MRNLHVIEFLRSKERRTGKKKKEHGRVRERGDSRQGQRNIKTEINIGLVAIARA